MKTTATYDQAIARILAFQVRSENPSAGATSFTGPYGYLLSYALNEGTKIPRVAERIYVRSNFVDERDPGLRYIQDFASSKPNWPVAVDIEMLAINPLWNQLPRDMKLDSERFRRGAKLEYGIDPNHPDLAPNRWRHYNIGGTFVWGPGPAAMRLIYEKLTDTHFSSLCRADDTYEICRKAGIACSIRLFDRIDQPSCMVYRRYRDGDLTMTVSGSFLAGDVDLDVEGSLNYNPVAASQLELDRLMRDEDRLPTIPILQAARDPRVRKAAKDAFNVWHEHGVVDPHSSIWQG